MKKEEFKCLIKAKINMTKIQADEKIFFY